MSQSLFYEYSITPDVFDADYISANQKIEVILPEILKGICKNGMIANLNKDGWIKHLENIRLPAVASIELKDQLLRLLKALKDRNRLVRHPKASNGDPANDADWLKLAIESHNHIKFDGIISTKHLHQASTISCAEFIDCLYVLNSPQWESRRHSLTLQSCEPYYRPVLDPVLRHAKSLTIVDPYFSPHAQKYMDFLKICIEQLGRRGQSILPGRIRIHAGNPDSENDYNRETTIERLNAWESRLKELYPSSILHKITIYLRKQKSGGKKFHDRFIMTDQCCIDIPMGTDTFSTSTPHSTTWSLLDYEDMQTKAQEIDPVMGVFEKLDERLLAV
ncbi:MAG: hypothetical protein WCL71_10700 [Deltaproteobacteria bacterium]